MNSEGAARSGAAFFLMSACFGSKALRLNPRLLNREEFAAGQRSHDAYCRRREVNLDHNLKARHRPMPIPERVQDLASVSLPTTGAGRKPCSNSADQRGRTDHETQDDGAAARPGNV